MIALVEGSQEGGGSLSRVVPAGPVWRLVQARQSAWGYSDKDMAQNRIEAVQQAHASGCSIDKVAEEGRLALSTVSRIAKREGLSFGTEESQAS